MNYIFASFGESDNANSNFQVMNEKKSTKRLHDVKMT